MQRLARAFEALSRSNRKALISFITAGDPDYATSLEILKGLPKAGADIIELGMPFSDPMADGPAIQRASQRALKSGQTLRKTLEMVRSFRKTDATTPIVLMGYYNPIYVFPVERFLAEAAEAGVDGLIVVDVPPEADDELWYPALKAGLNFIRLTAPTTNDHRLGSVLANASGFVYYVSIAGVTGTTAPDSRRRGAQCRADQGAHAVARRRWLRSPDAGTGTHHLKRGRWRGCRVGARRCAFTKS